MTELNQFLRLFLPTLKLQLSESFSRLAADRNDCRVYKVGQFKTLSGTLDIKKIQLRLRYAEVNLFSPRPGFLSHHWLVHF